MIQFQNNALNVILLHCRAQQRPSAFGEDILKAFSEAHQKDPKQEANRAMDLQGSIGWHANQGQRCASKRTSLESLLVNETGDDFSQRHQGVLGLHSCPTPDSGCVLMMSQWL